MDPSTDASDLKNLGNRQKPQGLQNPLALTNILPSPRNGTAGPNNSLAAVELGFETAIVNLVNDVSNNTGWTGVLGDIETNLFMNISINKTTFSAFIDSFNHSDDVLNSFTIANFSQIGLNLTLVQPLPWFTTTRAATDDDMDDQISDDIRRTLNYLSQVNGSSGIRLSYRSGSIRAYPAVSTSIQIVSNMPWGNLRFSKVQNGSYGYMIQAGTDTRLSNVASYPHEGLRMIAFQTMLSKAAGISFVL